MYTTGELECGQKLRNFIARLWARFLLEENMYSFLLSYRKGLNKQEVQIFPDFHKVGEVMIKWPTREIPTTLKEIEEVVILTDGVKWKFDGVVDSVPPDEGYEVLDWEMNDEEWDKNDSKHVADSDDTYNMKK